jgi:hypothetical protein
MDMTTAAPEELLGLVNGFRMTRLKDPEPSAGGDEMLLA